MMRRTILLAVAVVMLAAVSTAPAAAKPTTYTFHAYTCDKYDNGATPIELEASRVFLPEAYDDPFAPFAMYPVDYPGVFIVVGGDFYYTPNGLTVNATVDAPLALKDSGCAAIVAQDAPFEWEVRTAFVVFAGPPVM